MQPLHFVEKLQTDLPARATRVSKKLRLLALVAVITACGLYGGVTLLLGLLFGKTAALAAVTLFGILSVVACVAAALLLGGVALARWLIK